MTYKEAYDKIIEAYFKDEIKPCDAEFCFCGTLCDNSRAWHKSSIWAVHRNFGTYRGREYVRMEGALLGTISRELGCNALMYDDEELKRIFKTEYEDALFSGMCAALDVLKQIHIERGEIIDDLPSLTKRVLA